MYVYVCVTCYMVKYMFNIFSYLNTLNRLAVGNISPRCLSA